MAFSLPSDLATDWVDGVGMIENAAYLNAVAAAHNAQKAALLGTANGAAGAVVATGETTTSATYTDLATTTDTVTVTIGPSGMALVMMYANLTTNNGNQLMYMSYAASGANTVAAADTKALVYSSQYNPGTSAFGITLLETGLSTGSTTFKLKYRVSTAAAVTFANRRIAVIPFF